MKNFFSLLVFLSALATAQNHRFVYEYKYIPNSKEKDTIRKDMMALDITEKGSIYQSLSSMERDSIVKARVAEMMKNPEGNKKLDFSSGKFQKGSVEYVVNKSYPDYKTTLKQRVQADTYIISDDKKIDWKIGTETQKIMNYTVQKATTNFGGRNWVAWFTTDLPFPDGPYKFHGLPGLIVKLEDSTGSHIMTMVANKKLNQTAEEEKLIAGKNGASFSFAMQEIAVNEAQFKKAWKNFITDPGKNLREMSSKPLGGAYSSTVVFAGENGKPMDAKEMMKNLENSVKKMLETNNNRIEPTLYN
jgi:GLPGLI family protein